MGAIRKIVRWMWARTPAPISWWRVILWWELRRIPFNLLVALIGAVSVAVFFVAITRSGELQPGEDAVEPMALLVAPFVVNVCYTLGWMVELPARWLIPSLNQVIGPRLMKAGLLFSLVAITLPAIIWLGVWVTKSLGH